MSGESPGEGVPGAWCLSGCISPLELVVESSSPGPNRRWQCPVAGLRERGRQILRSDETIFPVLCQCDAKDIVDDAFITNHLDVISSYFQLKVLVTLGTAQLTMYSLLYRDANGVVTTSLRYFDTK